MIQDSLSDQETRAISYSTIFQVAAAILLFAKAPVPGRVKTRLQPEWTPLQAAALHRAFVDDLLDTLTALHAVTVELHTDILTDAWDRPGVSKHLQCTGDLGARMLHALERSLQLGRVPTLIVGGDAPTVPASHIQELLAMEADVALGPSEDGGYYAISCRRTHPAMFEAVEWSSPRALEQTAKAARNTGLSVGLGPAWFDIDCANDLARLAEVPRHTAAVLARWSGLT
jgi:rSAM/selenodomain-associated transferase 1